jgi:competence ComEA-like helix-hairpin-helix protein
LADALARRSGMGYEALVRARIAGPLGMPSAAVTVSPEMRARLARRGIPLLRTDRDGSVRIESDGRSWWVVGHQIVARGPPGEKAAAKPKRDHKTKPAGRINVNTATAAELEALPGIGPVIAWRIIEGRPYRSVEELERVKGIGKRRLEEIRPMVTAE